MGHWDIGLANCPIAVHVFATFGRWLSRRNCDMSSPLIVRVAGMPRALPGRMTSKELRTRCERFAVDVLRFSAPLLDGIASRDSALQLRRSATSVAQNYAACTIARSHAEFVAKIRIALEEADESNRWLRMMQAAGLAEGDQLKRLTLESMELTKILSASCATAAKNVRAKRRTQ